MRILDFFPRLNNRSFFSKITTLLFLILVCFVVLNVFGLALAIPVFGLDMVLNFDQNFDYSDEKSITFLKYLQVFSQLGIFVLPAIFYAYLENRRPGEYLGLNKSISFIPLILSVLLILVSIPSINYLVRINEAMSLPSFLEGVENWMRKMEDEAAVMTNAFLGVNNIGGLLVNLFIIALMAAIGEELLFRGVILGILRDSFKNIHLAVFVSAIIFSAFHGQFYGFIPRAFLGMLFGYIFVWTSNLWIPIVLHFVFNSISVIGAYLFETGRINTNYEDLGEDSGNTMIIASTILTIILLFLIYRTRPKLISDD